MLFYLQVQMHNKGDYQFMRNETFRKFIVYAMVALMLLSSLMIGLSFVL